MVYFQTKNSYLGNFYGRSVYFTAKRYILWPFGTFCHFVVIWCVLSRLGKLYEEKSGKPWLKVCTVVYKQSTSINNVELLFLTRVARFFLVQTCQNDKNIPNDHKLYQTAINYTKWP
jgi:hypothetical protein